MDQSTTYASLPSPGTWSQYTPISQHEKRTGQTWSLVHGWVTSTEGCYFSV
jgi:hypothetical protein